jgi:hypothetical protein
MHALAAFDDTALQALLETLDAVGRDINAVPDDLPPASPRRTPPQYRRDGWRGTGLVARTEPGRPHLRNRRHRPPVTGTPTT